MMRLFLLLLLIPTAAALLDAPNATVNGSFTFSIDPQELGDHSIIGVYLPSNIEVEVPEDAYYHADEHLLVFEDLDGPISITAIALELGDMYYEIVYIVPPRQAGIEEFTALISLPPEPVLVEPVEDQPRSVVPLLVGAMMAIVISVTLGYLWNGNR